MTKGALFQGYEAHSYLKVNQYNLHMIRSFNEKKAFDKIQHQMHS